MGIALIRVSQPKNIACTASGTPAPCRVGPNNIALSEEFAPDQLHPRLGESFGFSQDRFTVECEHPAAYSTVSILDQITHGFSLLAGRPKKPRIPMARHERTTMVGRGLGGGGVEGGT